MMFTALPLPTLPKPPEHFIERARALGRSQGGGQPNLNAKLYTQSGYLDREMTLPDGTRSKTRHVENFDMGDDWTEWVKENITPTFIETGVRTSVGFNAPVHGPHVDTITKWKFFYLIEAGGPNVLTSYYVEPGQPAIRYSTPDNIVSFTEYDKIVAIEHCHYPEGEWVFMDARIIHGVSNMLGDRIALVVSVRPEDVMFEIKPRSIA